MKLSTFFASLVVTALIGVPAAANTGQTLPGKIVYQSKASKNNLLNRLRKQAGDNEAMVLSRSGLADDVKPVFELPLTDKCGDLDGPNGEMWYYTASLTYEYKQMNEFWTDYFLRHYVFTITTVH